MLLNRVAHFILIVVIGAVTLLVAQGAVDLNRLQNSTEHVRVQVRLLDHFGLVQLLPRVLGQVIQHGPLEMMLDEATVLLKVIYLQTTRRQLDEN